MKITCDEVRNDVIYGLIGNAASVASMFGVLEFIDYGAEGARYALLVIACIFGVIVPVSWFLGSRRSYRFSGMILEHLWRGRVVEQWDLQSVEFRVLKHCIVINNRSLKGLSSNGRAFRIISRRLIRIVQQDNARVEPVSGWRQNLRILIWAMVLMPHVLAFPALLLIGSAMGVIWFAYACNPEVSRRSIYHLLSICLLITMVIFPAVCHVTCKRRKAFRLATFIFLGRLLRVDETDASPPNPKFT